MINQMPAPGHGSRLASVPWSAKDGLLGVALVAGVSLFAIALLSLLLDDPGVEDGSPLILIVLALLQGLMVMAAWIFGVKKYGARWRALGFARPQARGILLLPWLILLLSLLSFGLYITVMEAWDVDFLLPPEVPASALGDGFYKMANIVIIGVLGPMAEEVFFRGFLLAALLRPLGALRAVAVCSAFFAVSHGSLGLLVPVFVSGMLLSWLYLRTRSIWPPFAAHAAQNLIALNAISLAG